MEENEKYFQSIMTQIQYKTSMSEEDVSAQIDETMKLYGFNDRLTALLLVTGEIEKKENVKIYLNKKIYSNKKKEVKNMEEKQEESFEVEKLEDITYDLSGTQDTEQSLAIIPAHKITRYPSEDEIRFLIDRHKFVKESLLDDNDIIVDKRGKRFVKKSGWRKFINAFGITIKLIEKKVYEQFGDKHAEVRVKAIAPNGQSVEGVGVKSWSELFEKTMHNLQANAWTRAVNRAVSDLVGYGATSAEEEVLKDGK